MLVLSAVLILSACGGGGGFNAGDTQPPSSPTVAIEPAFAGVSFSRPVGMLQVPGGSTRWFVVEQAGRVRVFDNNAALTSSPTFIDISARVTFTGET
jgi:hypothetical protein